MSLVVRKSEAFLADLDAPGLISSGDAMFGPAGVLAPSRVRAEPSRAVVHTGQVVTWNQMMASNFQFCPNIDQLSADSPPPIHPDAQGRYPVPVPGQWTEV
jgi:hypothetical protein